jgi:8-oxo-dGTP pyrophosphatase MutT (NUDIX family)
MLEVTIIDMKLEQEVLHKCASRALIIKDNRVAILHSKKYNFYVTPGGGVESGETLEVACIREAKEETGLIIKPIKQIAVLDTNYPRIRIKHNYFICELLEDSYVLDMTEQEQDQDLELKWMTLEEVKKAFATHSPILKYDIWMQRESVVLAELRSYIK